ncbi:hypothetical protein GMST_35210 [Geomonas silvestris]|uniref:Sel1 repeat family protein n=1 Tax=Geomonas silvestris TaxID=2740184 RepID=A0A6V8MMG2_9BACT|nr:hypothetical protein GMST_35210 [Geomonas silvestris]
MHPQARFSQPFLIAKGRSNWVFGEKPDLTQARRWYEKAVTTGDASGKANVERLKQLEQIK